MVETHSYKLSPFGAALQFGGGSIVISASSFCILLALVLVGFEDTVPKLAGFAVLAEDILKVLKAVLNGKCSAL